MIFVVREKWVETRTDCYIDPSSSLDHSSTSFASWLGLLNRGSLKGPKPSVCSWFSLRHPVSNWLEPLGHLVILFSNAHLLPLFFRLFSQVHFLIDGSVEGQYITNPLARTEKKNKQKTRTCRIVDFTVQVDHRVKSKEREKRDKCLDLSRKLKKTMERRYQL